MVHEEEDDTSAEPPAIRDQEQEAWNLRKDSLILALANNLITGDLSSQIQAARDIRKLVRKSSSPKTRSKIAAAGVIPPLILMLLSHNLDAREASLLALLNLAVRNESYSHKLVRTWSLLSRN